MSPLLQSDLVSPDVLDDVKAQVRAINAVAEVRCTQRSAVDLGWILDTKCFSPELALAVDPSLGPAPASSSTDRRDEGDKHASHHEHSHQHEHQHADGEACVDCDEQSVEGPGGQACSVHDSAVTTCAVDLAGSLDLPRLERWLGGLLWDPPPGGTEVYRVKGVVSVEGRDERFVVQGVADLFEVAPAGVVGSAWAEGEARRCKVVFIGRMLSKQDLEQGFRSCMVEVEG